VSGLSQASRQAVRRDGELEAFRRRALAQRRQVNGIPPAAQSACSQLGLMAHREQERPHGLPRRRGQTALDPAHRSLRRARPACERALAQAEPQAVSLDETSKRFDT
jgi:hypothetical protein